MAALCSWQDELCKGEARSSALQGQAVLRHHTHVYYFAIPVACLPCKSGCTVAHTNCTASSGKRCLQSVILQCTITPAVLLQISGVLCHANIASSLPGCSALSVQPVWVLQLTTVLLHQGELLLHHSVNALLRSHCRLKIYKRQHLHNYTAYNSTSFTALARLLATAHRIVCGPTRYPLQTGLMLVQTQCLPNQKKSTTRLLPTRCPLRPTRHGHNAAAPVIDRTLLLL
jgi:hypothetical protein